MLVNRVNTIKTVSVFVEGLEGLPSVATIEFARVCRLNPHKEQEKERKGRAIYTSSECQSAGPRCVCERFVSRKSTGVAGETGTAAAAPRVDPEGEVEEPQGKDGRRSKLRAAKRQHSVGVRRICGGRGDNFKYLGF